MKSFLKVIFLSLAVVFAFSTCENPVGLGMKVNTEKPVINTAGDENKPGDFIQGDGNIIWLEVEQEFGIERVYMEVEYVDINNPNAIPKPRKIIEAEYDEESKQWFVRLDTTGMEDGSIKAWVTAIDVNGNKTTTTDIVYFVKNTPPQIKLNMPLIEGDNWDDDVFLDGLGDSDPLFLGFELIGLATDNYGMEEGYPKIMIWPADNPLIQVDADEIPLPDNGLYGTWRPLVVSNPKPGLTAAKFSWPMQRLVQDSSALGGFRLPQGDEPRTYLSQGRYRIRIVTKDLFGNENYYPERTDHGTKKASKKYVEINYIASDIPIVQVTTYPQYYNAANNFEIHFLVSCTNELAAVNPAEAYITDGNDGFENELGGPYYPTQLSFVNNPYQFKLTITPEQAKAWKNPKEGTLFVRLIGQDKNEKKGPPTYQHFQYDVTPPEVPIDRPVALTNIAAQGKLNGGSYTILYPSTETPKWVTGSITVGGINTDDNGIKEVYYHIGKLGDDFSPGSYWSEHYNDGDIWTDTKLNTSKPDDGWSGSVYAWTYTKSYPIGFKKGNLTLVQEHTELNNYSAESNYQTNDLDDRERFYLPFYVKVVDFAGNFHIMHYKLSIDPLLDEPYVTIAYPLEGATVGGTLRLSGSATDNYWMHTVLIRVTKVGTPGYYLPETTPSTVLFYAGENLAIIYPQPTVNGVKDTAGWFKANKTGDDVTVSWSYSLNQDRKLDPPESDPDGLQDVIIEVVAIDTNEISHQTPHITGPIAKVNVKFSSKVPIIEKEQILKDNVDPVELTQLGTKTSGKFSISIDISAMQGFNNVKARINNLPSSDRNIMVNNGVQTLPAEWKITPLPPSGDRVNYNLTILVDSTATTANVIPKAIPYGETGSMTLELTLEDNTENHFTTTGTWNIGIDNFYPTAVIETSRIASGNFLVEGTAQDWAAGSGDIQGLERVLVYIEKAKINRSGSGRTVYGSGTYLRPNGSTANDASEWISYPDVIDTAGGYTGKIPNVPSFAPFPKLVQKEVVTDKWVWTSPTAMVIDYAENAPTEDYDGDGTYGEMWNGLLDKSWGARLDTTGIQQVNTGFSDGPYIVHYIVMDQAGNATHYTKDIFVENNKPVIKSINIGTDIDFNGTVDSWSSTNPGEFMQNAYTINLSSANYNGTQTVPSNEFRIRNNLFGIRLELDGGNGQKNAVVSYVDNSTTVHATAMQRGYVYQIETNAQTTDFTKYGAPNNYRGTVFIASGEGEGTAEVKEFKTVGSFYNTYTNLGLNDVTKTITFDKFSIPPATIPDGDSVQFIVKVYDSALSTALDGTDNEYDQLASVFLLKVAVDNIDKVPPTINVTDFGQKWITEVGLNVTDDSKKTLTALTDAVYSDYVETNADGDKLGYVQYQAHSSPTTTANISGKVIFNGKAADNHRIMKITVQIPGYNDGNELDIATRNTLTGQLERANYIAGEREFRIVYPSVPQYSLEYGHALTWQFMWDSSKVTNSVASNIDITFRVYDTNSATPSATTSIKNVNIVPYITEVETPLSGAYAASPSAFNRSALGGYPVKEGDSITIKGFNLGTFTTNNATSNVTIGGGINYVTLISTDRSLTTIKGTIPTGAISGDLTVRVNNIDSFNNSSNKNIAYNQEPNGVNNNVLDNGRYVYVWKTGYLMNLYDGVVKNPFFRIGADGTRYMTFGTYDGNGRWRVLKNNTFQGANSAGNPSQQYIEQLNNRFLNLTIAVDQAGDWYAGASNQTSTGTGNDINFTFFARRNSNTDNHSNAGYNKRRILSMYNGTNTNENRVRIPRIYAYNTNGTTTGTATNMTKIFMSYYDGNSTDNPVVFRYGTVGATGTDTSDNFGGDLGYAYNTARNENNAGTSAWGSFGGTTTNTTNNFRQIVADNSTKYKGSEYTAVGGLSTGRPVIAWYDSSSQSLIFSYGISGANNTSIVTTTTNGTGGTNASPAANSWQGNARVVADSAKGAHVDMAVDGADNVHLAYYDVNNGGLYYAYIPFGNTATSPGTIQTVRVDTFLAVGTKLMINVRSEGTGDNQRYVPYITYYHGTFTDTKNAIRVAWRKDFSSDTVPDGTNEKDFFTGKWEVMTVPARDIPLSGEFICNGVPTSSGGWADFNLTGGYTTGVSALTRGTTNQVDLSKSIVIGYMTSHYYEGAMLNGDMSAGLPAK